MKVLRVFAGLMLSVLLLAPAMAAPTQASIELAEKVFSAKSVSERDDALKQISVASGDDLAVAIYTQGAVRFFQSLEALGQDLNRYGFESPGSFVLPLMRLPVPPREVVDPLDYAAFRQIFERFHTGMTEAAALLSTLPAGEDFGITVDFNKLGLDLNGDGLFFEGEFVAPIVSAFRRGLPSAKDGKLVFRFDRADAIWLRGYANVLAAQADFWLAHDFQVAFDNSFHMLFPRAKLPLQDELVPVQRRFSRSLLRDEWRLADLVSFIHYVNWPVIEPVRRQRARTELLEMISLSRQNWAAIKAETDNDREWLPGPQQPGEHPLTGLVVGSEQVDGWMKALDLAEDLLTGKRLLPHFRFDDSGLDMKRFFDEPHKFDLVATITGPAAIPYLAKGDIVTSKQFNEIRQAFGRNSFMGFALWFN